MQSTLRKRRLLQRTECLQLYTWMDWPQMRNPYLCRPVPQWCDVFRPRRMCMQERLGGPDLRHADLRGRLRECRRLFCPEYLHVPDRLDRRHLCQPCLH